MLYYLAISVFVLSPGSPLKDQVEVNVELNDSELSSDEVDTGGLFGTGVDFGRFFGFVTIGVGLPDDTPEWFAFMFSLWQIVWLVFSVGFVVSSIWDG